MSKLPVYTYANIKALNHSFDPVKSGCMTADQTITALDALRLSDMPVRDRLQLALEDGWIPDNALLHEFALWCAEQALALIPEPDPRSIAALEVKRRWLRKEATDKALRIAAIAADAAILDAQRDAGAHAGRTCRFPSRCGDMAAKNDDCDDCTYRFPFLYSDMAAISAAWAAFCATHTDASNAAASASWFSADTAREAAFETSESAANHSASYFASSRAASYAEDNADSAQTAAWDAQAERLIALLESYEAEPLKDTD